MVVDAAFARYLREAADYAGGRREVGRGRLVVLVATRRITIRSSSTATSTGRCPAQCSA